MWKNCCGLGKVIDLFSLANWTKHTVSLITSLRNRQIFAFALLFLFSQTLTRKKARIKIQWTIYFPPHVQNCQIFLKYITSKYDRLRHRGSPIFVSRIPVFEKAGSLFVPRVFSNHCKWTRYVTYRPVLKQHTREYSSMKHFRNFILILISPNNFFPKSINCPCWFSQDIGVLHIINSYLIRLTAIFYKKLIRHRTDTVWIPFSV